jgi:hypothetical protein
VEKTPLTGSEPARDSADMQPPRSSPRARALRTAAIVAGLAASASSMGCDRVVARVLDGTGMDGGACAGWSIRHGSPERCCQAIGAAYDPVSASCINLAVPGPFVPPAMSG